MLAKMHYADPITASQTRNLILLPAASQLAVRSWSQRPGRRSHRLLSKHLCYTLANFLLDADKRAVEIAMLTASG